MSYFDFIKNNPIPQHATKFQGGDSMFGYEIPAKVEAWKFNEEFNRWSALCTFKNGQKVWTYPQIDGD